MGLREIQTQVWTVWLEEVEGLSWESKQRTRKDETRIIKIHKNGEQILPKTSTQYI